MARQGIVRGIVAAIALACAAIVVQAQGSSIPRRSGLPGSGTIMGRVVLPTGGAVSSNVRIRLSNFATAGVISYTDSNGEFNFRSLGSGTYQVEVMADPELYETVTETINLPPNGRVVVTINLRARVSNRRPAPDVVSVAELDQDVPAAAKKAFEKATELIRKNDAEAAIKHLKEAIALFPDYLIARNTLGVEYLKLKLLREAAEQLEASIKIGPKSFVPRLYLGIVMVQQKKYPEAMGHLNEAVSLNSEDGTAYLYLGVACLGGGDLAPAESALLRALSVGGRQYSLAHYYLAHVYLKRNEPGQASEALKTYLRESPNGEQSAHARSLLEKLK